MWWCSLHASVLRGASRGCRACIARLRADIEEARLQMAIAAALRAADRPDVAQA